MNIRLYARISKIEDENETSIENQLDLLKEYVKNNEELRFGKIYEYSDADISGYTFDRPAFNQMLKDINETKNNILIVKDLSRLGRNNAQVLLLLENFKENEVRVISVNDNYDTFKDDDDIIGIKTWFNERYIKDLSRKIKTVLHNKQKKGEVICSRHLPIGYKLNTERQVVIDEEKAPIIRKIFELYATGYRTPFIQKKLKDEIGININRDTILKILRNDIYIGVWRTKKTYRNKMGGVKKKYAPNEQYVFYNHHPAIIEKDLFDKVQQILDSTARPKHKKYEYLFSGKIVCGLCGETYAAVSTYSQRKCYRCNSVNKSYMPRCNNKGISEKRMLEIVNNEFRKFIFQRLKEIEDEILKLLQYDKDKIQQEINKLETQIQKNKNKIAMLYDDRLNNIIDTDMFIYQKQKIEADIKKCEDEIEKLKNSQNKVGQLENEKEMIVKLIHSKTQLSTKEDINLFIDKIEYIHSKDKPEQEIVKIYWAKNFLL